MARGKGERIGGAGGPVSVGCVAGVVRRGHAPGAGLRLGQMEPRVWPGAVANRLASLVWRLGTGVLTGAHGRSLGVVASSSRHGRLGTGRANPVAALGEHESSVSFSVSVR